MLWLMIPIGIIIVMICFYVLGSTADGYLSPALETITVKLGISESLAGVTFLAFANGAPDVVSALVASSGGEGDDGVYLAISALLGAGLFVSCVVGAVVILAAKSPIHVYPRVYLRDVGFYMLGPVILAISASTGKLSLPFAIAFLVVYAIFVIVVVISDQVDRSKVRTDSTSIKHVHSQQLLNDSNKLSDEINDEEELDNNPENIILRSNSVQLNDSVCNIFDSKDLNNSVKDAHFGENDDTYSINDNHKLEQKSNFANSVNRTKSKVAWGLVKMKRFLHRSVKPEDPWSKMNIIQKILYIILDVPLDFCRRITIPPANDEQWDRRFAMAFPICSVIFFYLASGNIDFTGAPPISFYICLGVGFIWSFIIFYTCKAKHAPEKFILLYAIFSLLMSVVWIWWVANILVDMLKFFGMIFNMKTAFLGITVLAWGNSIGDLMANPAIARKGFARMAITGSIAGPLFNLFFGLGISLIKSIISGEEDNSFSFTSNDCILPTVAGACLFGGLAFMFLSIIQQKFVLRKWLGVVLIAYYILSLTLLSILAFAIE